MADAEQGTAGRMRPRTPNIPAHVRFTIRQMRWIRAKAAGTPGGIAAVIRGVVDQMMQLESAGLAESLESLVALASNRLAPAADPDESGPCSAE